MLRKYSNSRSLSDNVKLGAMTAFVAGMVNVASLLIFLSFSSNVTGYYAILATEIINKSWHQVLVVGIWIFLYFFGSFTSNLIIIHFKKQYTYLAHATPIIIEIACLISVAIYGNFFYKETLMETEILLSLLLFAMGLQNGLTASISNFAVKTTHLTGATTDLGVLLSMFTKKRFRKNKELKGKVKLIAAIMASFVAGAIISAFLYQHIVFNTFYVVCGFLVIVIFYDLYRLRLLQMIHRNRKAAFIKAAVSPANNVISNHQQDEKRPLSKTPEETKTLVY